jgi:hypothetical protein
VGISSVISDFTWGISSDFSKSTGFSPALAGELGLIVTMRRIFPRGLPEVVQRERLDRLGEES